MIAVVISIPLGYIVFIRTENSLFAQYARESPYDGQDGLAAFYGAVPPGFWTFVGTSIVLFLLQRLIPPKGTP
jgi:hypothetical protein